MVACVTRHASRVIVLVAGRATVSRHAMRQDGSGEARQH